MKWEVIYARKYHDHKKKIKNAQQNVTPEQSVDAHSKALSYGLLFLMNALQTPSHAQSIDDHSTHEKRSGS